MSLPGISSTTVSMKEALFSVQGMTCGACSASVTEAVAQITGVQDVAVSLITEEAKVVYDSPVEPAQIIEAISDCGFDGALIKSTDKLADNYILTSVTIEGMSCGSCSASITEALEKIPGVESASISLVTESGSIKHTSAVSDDNIREAVENCGFGIQFDGSKLMGNTITEYETTFAVSGMTCGACTASITEALENNEYVVSASVSLITEEALVIHTDKITPEELQQIIDDAGFDASMTKSITRAALSAQEDDETSLQIYGITDETDLTLLQYNIEAYLNSLPGVIDFQLAFMHSSNTTTPEVTDANSTGIRGLRSTEEQEVDDVSGNFIDELAVTYNSKLMGIRYLVDGLNDISEGISFVIVNSVDRSSSSQLKLLSRIKEIQYWKSTFFKSLIFGLPIVILSKTQELKLWKSLLIFPGLYVVSLIQFVLAIHVEFNLGRTFIKKFFLFVKNRGKNATMDVLVCISTMISFIFSVLAIILSVWNGQTVLPPSLLFDTAAMVVSFISFGKWLENKAKGATSTSLSKLLSLTPTNCTIINDTEKYDDFLATHDPTSEKGKPTEMMNFSTRNISIDLIQTNDIAVVLPGSKVPADGLIVFGESEIDESIITGESLPVFKQIGDLVIGGSINGPDLIHIRVVSSGKKSQLQQIINLVKESQVNKAAVQRFADYVAARFVPCVLVLSTVTFSFWVLICYLSHNESLPMMFASDNNGKYFVCLKLAISVVVVACPCALGLAAPTAVMVGTGVGASHGVLIKGGDVLEKATSVNIILFDKTGTLTTGGMKLVNYKNSSKFSISNDEWWQLIGSVETNSNHPVGSAITKAAREQLNMTFEEDLFSTTIKDFNAMTGLGAGAIVQFPNGNKHTVDIGNKRMIQKMYPALIEEVESELAAIVNPDTLSNTLSHVIIDKQYAGYLELTDSLKDKAKEVIDYLTKVEKYQVGIVTGDSHGAASKIGRQLGIPESNIFSEVSPINKDKVIVDIRRRLGKDVGIAFVGDGINDAPALVQADIGMAISSGTDIAIDSADVVLIGGNSGHSDLQGVLNAFKISGATFRKVKVNFIWAAVYNFIMLPFAMGFFLPLNVMLPPIAAGGAMALSSVSVVVSSLWLKKWTPPQLVSSFDVDFEDLTDHFSLRSGTAEEFSEIKRTRKTFSFEAFFKKLNGKKHSPREPEYEMLATV